MTRRGSDWEAFLRCLIMLRRLMLGPVTSEEWFQAVEKSLGGEVYPKSKSARTAAQKHDRERLRNRFQVEFQYDPSEGKFHLNDAGPLGYLELSNEQIQGLTILAHQFKNPSAPPGVSELIDYILNSLDPQIRKRVENNPLSILINQEQNIDHSQISNRVWKTISRAVQEKRKLSFNYLSPRYSDGKSIYHEVAPHHIRFQDGHWYLRAYNLLHKELYGTANPFVRFRISYILDDEKLQVLPTVIDTHHKRLPRYLVHYRLAPYIGRGEISHRFEEMKITRLEDGSAEVRGITDDIWEAARILLSYGEGCIVLGGEELVREIRRRVEGMARNYGLLKEL